MTQRARHTPPHHPTRHTPAFLENLEPRIFFSATSAIFGPSLPRSAHQTHPPAHAATQKDLKFAANAVLAIGAARPAGAAGSRFPGDVNGDGVVDIQDLNAVVAHWQQIVPPGTGADLDGNGVVDIQDLNQVVAHWQQHAPAGTVTAPTTYNWQTQVVNGVLNVWAPNPSDFGSTWTVNDPSALFGTSGTPSITAIQQGQIADCYFLAAIGALALNHPAAIMQAVQNDPNGGWIVTFQYTNPSTGLTSPVIFHTDDELSSTWQTEADGQVWDLVMEKAFAAFRTWNGSTSTDTMASIGWGYPNLALTQVNESNQPIYIWNQTPQTIYNTIANDVAAHLPILFQTSSTAPDMVQSHVYVIVNDYTDANGVAWVTTYNPWGFYDTRTETDLLQNGIGSLTVGLV